MDWGWAEEFADTDLGHPRQHLHRPEVGALCCRYALIGVNGSPTTRELCTEFLWGIRAIGRSVVPKPGPPLRLSVDSYRQGNKERERSRVPLPRPGVLSRIHSTRSGPGTLGRATGAVLVEHGSGYVVSCIADDPQCKAVPAPLGDAGTANLIE